jgi:ABC-type transport system substrate-binding protein
MNKKINNRTSMIWGIAWSADYPDAENFLQLLYGPNRAPGSNKSGYDNPEFNKLFEKASRMQDSPERTALYEKLNRLVAEDTPWIFGVHRQSYVLRHSWLKNYMSTDFDMGQAQYLNIDLKEKAEMLKKL